MKKPLLHYRLILNPDGDIEIRDIKSNKQVAHFSFNPGDSVYGNLIRAYHFWNGFESGKTFDEMANVMPSEKEGGE